MRRARRAGAADPLLAPLGAASALHQSAMHGHIKHPAIEAGHWRNTRRATKAGPGPLHQARGTHRWLYN